MQAGNRPHLVGLIGTKAAESHDMSDARGFESFATRSAGVSVPVAPSPASVAVGVGSRFHTTISCPSRISRRVRLAPIRPNPIIPNCMLSPIRDGQGSGQGTIAPEGTMATR